MLCCHIAIWQHSHICNIGTILISCIFVTQQRFWEFPGGPRSHLRGPRPYCNSDTDSILSKVPFQSTNNINTTVNSNQISLFLLSLCNMCNLQMSCRLASSGSLSSVKWSISKWNAAQRATVKLIVKNGFTWQDCWDTVVIPQNDWLKKCM